MKILTTLFYLLISTMLLSQSTDALQNAIRLSHNQRFIEAELIFDSLMRIHSFQVSKLNTARAYNYSWNDEQALAIDLFKKEIALHPENINALNGIAYALSWSGKDASALQYFQKTISLDPYNRSALFGMAYNYIRKNNLAGAKYVAKNIAEKYETEAEYYYLLGLIAIAEFQPKEARSAFEKCLEINPNYDSAANYLEQIGALPDQYSLGVWYGISSIDNETSQGLRRIDFQYKPTSYLLLYTVYDNSLIQDNIAIRASNESAPFLSVGGKYGWNKSHFTKLEYGHRFFSLSPAQNLVSIEHTYFASNKLIPSIFLQFDDRGFENLMIVGGRINLGLTEHARLEIAYFKAQNLTFSNLSNERLIIAPKFNLGLIEWVIGAYYDNIKTPEVKYSKISGYYSSVLFPILKKLDGSVFFNYDSSIFNPSNTLIAVGVAYKF